MAEKSVAEKLQIKQGTRVLLVNAPRDLRDKLGVLPANASLSTKVAAPVDMVQFFATSRKELDELAKAKGALAPKGILWVMYPKGTSKNYKADINRDSIREYAATIGLQAVALVAIDDDWSALRLKRV